MLSRFYKISSSVGFRWLPFVIAIAISACGGSGGSSGTTANSPTIASQTSSIASSLSTTSSAGSNALDLVAVTGVVTYDRVPHNENHVGLNYAAIVAQPVRGAVVELLNDRGYVIANTVTGNNGEYSLPAPVNTLVKVQVKAELLQSSSPTWNFKVTDNTNNDSLYVLEGALAPSGTHNSQRNLHAGSGWDGSRYSAPRAAAPFAILDNIYTGVTRLNAAGNQRDLPMLELRWSTRNNSAEGIAQLGEIGTSFYDGTAIYILGDANNDADEYDAHVILHEWGHYLEQYLFRADSSGGNHSENDILDMRIAMSEGFANAFAAMLLDNPFYMDASGYNEAAGFYLDVSRRDRSVKGFYSEGSIGSIFYNYYLSSTNKAANDFSSIYGVLSNSSYYGHEAMTSIFLFYAQLKNLFADQTAVFNALMREQNIYGADEYATDEINDAGYPGSLPLYKSLSPTGGVVNACSSGEFGKYNKLANSQLLRLEVTQASSYVFSTAKSGGAAVTTWPEVAVFQRGKLIKSFAGSAPDFTSGSLSLAAGVYIVEVYDANNRNPNNQQRNKTCFNVQVIAN